QSIQLVVDGLMHTQLNPSFLDARDAILLADRLDNGGANQCALWQAFSKHGMGFSASTVDSGDSAARESFGAPPDCSDPGSIRLDRKNYLVGETIKIFLSDHNASTAQGAVTVTVKSSVNNDQETITLTQDGLSNGLFSANIRVVAGRAVPGDGSLQTSLQAGDKILVSYNDANNGGRSSAQ